MNSSKPVRKVRINVFDSDEEDESLNEQNEDTVFEIIEAFDIPKTKYDSDRKIFRPQPIAIDTNQFVAEPSAKADVFINRYCVVSLHVKKAFENSKRSLQTVDYLATYHSCDVDLQKKSIFILGFLMQLSETKFALEDTTGLIKIDLRNTNYGFGFYVENMLVLVTGVYEDKILYVKQMTLPPSESYQNSKVNLPNQNYFGGKSLVNLRASDKQAMLLCSPECINELILFFVDFRLDRASVFDKLRLIFEGFEQSPPYVFVFMGSFLTITNDPKDVAHNIYSLKKHLKLLADLINEFPRMARKSLFVFVPSVDDACAGHTLPRRSIPHVLTDEFCKLVANARFVSNPCRLRFCSREIVLLRLDLLNKLRFGSLAMPKQEDIAKAITRTITSQAHLCPVSIPVQSVHWNFDHALNLNPLPDLVVIGDKLYPYNDEISGCRIVNPGSFVENNWTFLSYVPATNTVDECSV